MLYQHALDIGKEPSTLDSPKETTDRSDIKGGYEAALEHLILANMTMILNGQETKVVSIDCNIGAIDLSLGIYDETSSSY